MRRPRSWRTSPRRCRRSPGGRAARHGRAAPPRRRRHRGRRGGSTRRLRPRTYVRNRGAARQALPPARCGEQRADRVAGERKDGPVSEAIRAAIDAAGGAIPFSEFQRLALYGPDGFYTRPVERVGRAGRRGGDFITSPEVGPLFGAVLARFLDAEWEGLGRPDPFTVVDAGAGPGTLARAVLAAAPRCAAALRYVAVEISESQRALHPPGVESRPRHARRPLRRRDRGQRAARQPADPAVRVRRVVARGLGGGRTGRHVRRGALGAARPAPCGAAGDGTARGPRPAPGRRRRLGGRGAGERRARSHRRLRLRPRHDRRARPPAVAGVAAHVPRPRARRPLPRRAGHPGHHGRARPRPVLRTGRRAHPGAVPAPVGDRRAGRRGRQRVDRTGGPPRPGRPRHAQPARRGRCPARPDRPRRLRRRGVDAGLTVTAFPGHAGRCWPLLGWRLVARIVEMATGELTASRDPRRQLSILLSRCRSTRRWRRAPGSAPRSIRPARRDRRSS